MGIFGWSVVAIVGVIGVMHSVKKKFGKRPAYHAFAQSSEWHHQRQRNKRK